jgi:Transglutaminase-like superfamily
MTGMQVPVLPPHASSLATTATQPPPPFTLHSGQVHARDDSHKNQDAGHHNSNNSWFSGKWPVPWCSPTTSSSSSLTETALVPPPDSKHWLRHRGGGHDAVVASSTTGTDRSSSTATAANSHNTMSFSAQDHNTTTTPASATTNGTVAIATQSVHLQLTDPSLVDSSPPGPPPDDKNEEQESTTEPPPTPAKPVATKTITIHTYHDPTTNTTWKALNTAKKKFQAYLQYRNAAPSGVVAGQLDDDANHWMTQIETVHHMVDLAPVTAATGSPSTDVTTADTETNTATTDTNATPISSHDQMAADDAKAIAAAAAAQKRKEWEKMRQEWRILWKNGTLITDRTELLAVYPSDMEQSVSTATSLQGGGNNGSVPPSSSPLAAAVRKRGGFADLLQLYTNRVLAILQDEEEDCRSVYDDDATANNHVSAASADLASSNNGLLPWLESNYGTLETTALRHDNFGTLTESEQLAKLKHFLEWFRSQFPYFYDRCDACGASIKEDNVAAVAAAAAAAAADVVDNDKSSTNGQGNPSQLDNSNLGNVENPAEADEEEDSDHRTFVGYMYPDTVELQGKASRTELYQCHVCHSFTRFPRFNSARHVIAKRRGRCGEYSMLLFRILRALGHECRWVVDWADHVWAEVLLSSHRTLAVPEGPVRRWVHLDPCEAAVDENFIYQDWGKKQTFILGFYLPPMPNEQSFVSGPGTVRGNDTAEDIPLIEDITQCYTREPWSDVCERREEPEDHIKSSIERATQDLLAKLTSRAGSIGSTSDSL